MIYLLAVIAALIVYVVFRLHYTKVEMPGLEDIPDDYTISDRGCNCNCGNDHGACPKEGPEEQV